MTLIQYNLWANDWSLLCQKYKIISYVWYSEKKTRFHIPQISANFLNKVNYKITIRYQWQSWQNKKRKLILSITKNIIHVVIYFKHTHNLCSLLPFNQKKSHKKEMKWKVVSFIDVKSQICRARNFISFDDERTSECIIRKIVIRLCENEMECRW